MKQYYWDEVSEQIGNILKSVFTHEMKICEVGFGGGHFLEWLNEMGYTKIAGIEIRQDQYNMTLENFKDKELSIDLRCGDVLNCTERFDGIYATGLIQCLDRENRQRFLTHISQMADLAVFTVPEIKENRNLESKKQVAVEGCREFTTGNIPYELSLYYDRVRVGKIKTCIDDDFIYYVCYKEKVYN